jgi:hypothetical protein
MRAETAMNGKLILQLSLFGLVMGIATVFIIPSTIEPVCWLVIFVICAYVIARQAPGRYFLHGLSVSIVNSLWITASHLLFFPQYIATHASEAAMMDATPFAGYPRLMMALTGPIVGVVSGLVLGLFAFVAAKLVGPKRS